MMDELRKARACTVNGLGLVLAMSRTLIKQEQKKLLELS